tara:strand:- start:70311 stop:70850 length:540 start_codon:yes stop_codon:yes gene_type:complete
MATVISDPSATANSYASLAFIKSQWDLNPNIEYSALTDEQIGNLGIFSTMSIDNEYSNDYLGALYDIDYSLFWPRTGAVDRRGVAITDYTIFPLDLQKAVAAQAWYLNSVDFVATENASGQISGVQSKSMDGLGSKSYFGTSEQKKALYKSKICSDARKYLDSLVSGSSSPYISIMQRG